MMAASREAHGKANLDFDYRSLKEQGATDRRTAEHLRATAISMAAFKMTQAQFDALKVTEFWQTTTEHVAHNVEAEREYIRTGLREASAVRHRQHFRRAYLESEAVAATQPVRGQRFRDMAAEAYGPHLPKSVRQRKRSK
jgi:hypothetical protein